MGCKVEIEFPAWQNQDGMQGPTQGPSIGESSTLRVRGGAGNEQFARTAQEIGRPESAEPSDPEKAYGIERLKKLEAIVFEGFIDPADVENWLNMLEKCSDVMNCPEERKVEIEFPVSLGLLVKSVNFEVQF
uniref:Retrotransposon protein n=1 Tax=Cucumis melo TaxID=3656 RepID=A0A9I9E7K2_CUCME